MTKPIVAIVGRQNVGKSTLLNRLAGKRIAIVSDLPGTTRDRIVAGVSWKESEFVVVDTGGLEPVPGSSIAQEVNQHIIDIPGNRVRRAEQVEVRLAQHIIFADHVQVHPAYPLFFQILMCCEVSSSSMYFGQPEKPNCSFQRQDISSFS